MAGERSETSGTRVTHNIAHEAVVFHLHLVSDATGETVNGLARACVSQFDQVRVVDHLWSLVRTARQLEVVMEGIRQHPGVVMFTLVDEGLRRRLEERCREMQVPAIAVLDPLINALGTYFGVRSQGQPGRQHNLDAEYFSRMDAMEFAIAHDDGQGLHDLHLADVVVIGVSRTSKTPTCLYLGNRGIRAANIPLVPGVPLPIEVDQVERPLIVGLTKNPDQLLMIRRNRLRLLNKGEDLDYVDPEGVRLEDTEARRLFSRRGWPVLDVSRRSIEETAAEIAILLRRKQDGDQREGDREE